ncbi:hypothetical protein ACWCPT_29685 [Streptomyces sp. NPDC002308]
MTEMPQGAAGSTARDRLLETIRNHAAGVGPLVTPATLNAAINKYGAEVLRTVATDWASHCPEHTTADEVWIDCPEDWVHELRSAADALETTRG